MEVLKDKKVKGFVALVLLTAMLPINTSAMHIMEGYLPPMWCVVWFVVSAPFVIYGAVKLAKVAKTDPQTRMLLALVAAFAFVLSALKIPSVTGSCSHPTGMGLAAIIFGPFVSAVVGLVVLLFQAILLAHGGLTTLGANVFSMAIAGPLLTYFVYWLLSKKFNVNKDVTVFLAASLGSLFTYVITAAQLSFAFPSDVGGFAASFVEFASIFAVTQVPLTIIEGLIVMIIFRYLRTHATDTLIKLGVIDETDEIAQVVTGANKKGA